MNDSSTRYIIDAVAVANVVATIVGWLPSVAAILSILWTSIQIYGWAKRQLSKRPSQPE